jgi:hypothetical protein
MSSFVSSSNVTAQDLNSVFIVDGEVDPTMPNITYTMFYDVSGLTFTATTNKPDWNEYTFDLFINIPGQGATLISQGNCSGGATVVCSVPRISGSFQTTRDQRFYIYMDINDHHAAASATYYTINFTGSVFFGFQPAATTCESQYVVVSNYIQDGLINPQVQSPQGSPTDQQKISDVVPYITYARLNVRGGPWNNGTVTTHYDTAVSWDGVTYYPIGSFPGLICLIRDPVHSDLYTAYMVPQAETFYIRANDTNGNFANNSQVSELLYDFQIVETVQNNDCSAQFVYDPIDDLVSSGEIIASEQFRTDPYAYTNGKWYAVEIYSGSWRQGGAPPDLYSADYNFFDSHTNGGSGFHNLDNSTDTGTNVDCVVQDGNYYTSFLYASGDLLQLSSDLANGPVNGNNTGSLFYKVYEVTKNETPSVCSSNYGVGDLVESGTVDSKAERGTLLDDLIKGMAKPFEGEGGGANSAGSTRSYMLEIYGGPWYANTATYPQRYDMQWGVDDNVMSLSEFINLIGSAVGINDSIYAEYTWETLQTAADCISRTSPYHAIYYFDLPTDSVNYYRLRVNDTDGPFGSGVFSDNRGTMYYRLYETTNTNIYDGGTLVDGFCSDYYALTSSPLGSVTIQANNEAGVALPGVVPGGFYVISVSGGPWNDGTTSHYDAALGYHINQTTYWSALNTSSVVSCAELYNTNYMRVYFRALDGYSYFGRANDSGSFGNNTGTITLTVWGITEQPEAWNNCTTAGYTYTRIPGINDEVIDSRQMMGQQILNLQAGQRYALEIIDGSWFDSPIDQIPRYDAELNPGTGSWYAFNALPNVLCVENAGYYERIFFEVHNGDIYRIRVNDTTDTFPAFLENRDGDPPLTYRLYSVNGSTFGDVDLPSGSVNQYCTLACSRPSSFLDIGGFIEYTRCSLQRYFAWCPRHSDAIISLINLPRHYEPFATVISMIDILSFIRNEINAYWWGPLSGNDPLAPDPVLDNTGNQFTFYANPNSPWNGAPIDFSDGAPTGSTTCSLAIIGTLGNSNATKSICFTSNTMKIINRQIPMLQGLISMGAVIFFMTYITKSWINQSQK